MLEWASRYGQRVILLYPPFANCSQEGTDPWRVPGAREMMKRSLARDAQILRKSERCLTPNERDLAAITRYLDLTGLGGQFKSSDMQPARKATLRKRRKGKEGGDLVIEDTDEEAPSLQYTPSLGSQREARDRQETESVVSTAEDVVVQGQRAELEHNTVAAAEGITRVSTPYIVSHRHMALFEDHQRKRPGIMTSSEMSDPEADGDPGPPRRHTRSRLQCEECGGANGLSRAWVFDVPLNQRRAHHKEDYNRTCTPGPVSLDSANDPSSSCQAVSRGALSAMTEPRPPVYPSPTPPPEPAEVEPEGADLSHQAHVVCRRCESRYYINRSLPFRHRLNRESEGMLKDDDTSEEDLWTVIREQSLHGLTDAAAWPTRVRTHKLWPEFVSRKCLGPSPNDNFCWEDKDPASFYGPRCAAHQSELAAGRVSLCGRHGCDEESMTWWTESGASKLRSQAPSLISSGDRPSRTRRSPKVYKTPLCDDCEEEARDEGRCFTCTTRLAPDDLAGRCEACYSNTSLHRDRTKEIARWESVDGQVTQLRAPWFLIQDHWDGNPL